MTNDHRVEDGSAPTALDLAVPVLEIGGTHVTAAWVRHGSGMVVASRRSALDSSASACVILRVCAEAAARLEEDLDGRSAGRHWGVALPGPFDYERGIGHYADVGKFESLAGVDVGRELTRRMRPGTRLSFINDADAFGVGEVLHGSAAGHDRALCVTLGTGVGSAFVDHGRPVGSGPEVPPQGRAHLLHWQGAPLEHTVSRRAVLRRFVEMKGAGADAEGLDVRDVAALARAGDRVALTVLTQSFTALGRCLAPWAASFGATVVVVGGSIAESWDLLEEPLTSAFAGACDPAPTVVHAADSARSALIGAASVATDGATARFLPPTGWTT